MAIYFTDDIFEWFFLHVLHFPCDTLEILTGDSIDTKGPGITWSNDDNQVK